MQFSPCVQRVVDLFLSGMTRGTIAKQLGVDPSTVAHQLKSAGICGTQHAFDPELQVQILELWNTGFNQIEIAELLNITQPRVGRYLHAGGVATFKNMKNPNVVKSISDVQRSIIVGTVLGDGHMDLFQSGASLTLVHCIKQLPWLEWKAGQLAPLFSRTQAKVRRVKKTRSWNVQKRSMAHPLLVDLYHLFHSRPEHECTKVRGKTIHKKMVTSAVLDLVDPLALAVWYGDDGCLGRTKRGDATAGIALGCMTQSEYDLIRDWFRSAGYWCGLTKMKDSNCQVLRMYQPGTRKFVRDIAPFLHESMHYKIKNVVPELVFDDEDET